MLHILMGRARTGKSERVLQRIAALGDSSQQILLVPEHASHVAEMDLCRVCGDTASRHAEALTAAVTPRSYSRDSDSRAWPQVMYVVGQMSAAISAARRSCAGLA